MRVHFNSLFEIRIGTASKQRWPAGFEGEVDDDIAREAIQAGAAVAAPAAPASDQGGPDQTRPAGDDLIDAIAEAIGTLDDANPEHWTSKGDPKTEALSDILGYSVSAAERNAAMERLTDADAA